MKQTLGERIRALRKGKGLTLRQLADATDLDFTYLSKIENNRLEHTPSLKALQRIAEELELMALADKTPPFLRDIVDNKEALQFFRKASKLAKSKQTWRALSRHLDEMEKGGGGKRGEGED